LKGIFPGKSEIMIDEKDWYRIKYKIKPDPFKHDKAICVEREEYNPHCIQERESAGGRFLCSGLEGRPGAAFAKDVAVD
jgi:hypothetical protein